MSYLYSMGVKIDHIKDRGNEMIDQIKTLIKKSFPPAIGFEAKYYEGEDRDTERQYLVFEIHTSAFGMVYRKAKKLGPQDTFFDVEHDFVGVVLTDFILLGTTHLTNYAMAKKASEQEDADNILKHPFSKGRLNPLNLN